MGEIVIVAPHPDDEIIGCFELLKEKPIIVYTEDVPQKRRDEAAKLLKEHELVKLQLFYKEVPVSLINEENTLYYPDPYFEIHPVHRKQGAIGERVLRDGYNVIFYSIQMNTPYIHEVEAPEDKKRLLDLVYPSQISLWDNDAKYYLFEGRCKWIMNQP